MRFGANPRDVIAEVRRAVIRMNDPANGVLPEGVLEHLADDLDPPRLVGVAENRLHLGQLPVADVPAALDVERTATDGKQRRISGVGAGQQLLACFADALARAPGDRDAFLRQACGDDEELKREVKELLGHHDILVIRKKNAGESK